MENNKTYRAGLYCRLSKDDEQRGESISIGTQRAILTDYCAERGYEIHRVYIDDGYSGLNFNRPGFQELLEDVELRAINMVITKDLSRLGRDYIMTGYYSEIFFPTKDVRYIAIADDFDSERSDNDFAPFKNILNDMYAKDISRKIKNAKRQRSKQGLFSAGQAPFGYRKADDGPYLVVDPEAAETVRRIFSLALEDLGEISIAKRLETEGYVTPSYYKFHHGDDRFTRFRSVKENAPYAWCPGTVHGILDNRVYTGDLINLKTEVVNFKTKKSVSVPPERQMVAPNAHEAIIPRDVFDRVQQIRAGHSCPANRKRENLFRGLLFCECCGHAMAISRKELKDRVADIYLCTHHYKRPDECPRTHRVYHDMLYPYVLSQVRAFARSMKRRKVNSPISQYADIQELTPEILKEVIERIEISHVGRKSKPGSVIRIYWRLR